MKLNLLFRGFVRLLIYILLLLAIMRDDVNMILVAGIFLIQSAIYDLEKSILASKDKEE